METLQDVFSGSSSKEIDYIQYAVYLPPKESENETIKYLKDTLDMINSHIQPMTKDYIWQKDKFHLSIVKDQQQDPSYPFLFGASRFGDCINDEWFIVHILKSISLHIPESVISLLDNDGDVLLIEAALDLPAWLDPSNSDNRVYLYQGQIHIIPLPTTPAAILQVPTTGRLLREKAIQQVRSNPRLTLASPSIQQAIHDRSHQELHRSTCILPNKAAFVLLSEPQLITLAIEAFYLRDPFSMKACASMSTFPPREGSAETVITFTKTTYAQAQSQKFYAPKPFRLPSVNEKRTFKQAELGMKVACGLEMLYYNLKQQQQQPTEDVETYSFDKDPKYAAYVEHLTKLGYFRTERKGSQLYKLLERQSKEQYLLYRNQDQEQQDTVSYDHLDAEDEDTFKFSAQVLSNGSSNARQRIDQLLAEYSVEALNQLLQENTHTEEDSDDWMNVDPQQLEELLMKRMGHMNESMMSDMANELGVVSEEHMDLEAIMNNFENFVEKSKSGVDGVVFPGEDDQDEEDDDSDDEEEEYNDDEEEEALKAVQFDLEKFMSILKGTSHVPEAEPDLGQVMEEMDREIYGHDKISGSFAKLSTNEEEEEEDEGAPVDVQLNLVKNVLESFKSQQGLPGPVSNILNQFGVVLPGDNEEE